MNNAEQNGFELEPLNDNIVAELSIEELEERLEMQMLGAAIPVISSMSIWFVVHHVSN